MDIDTLPDDPLVLFARWYDQAREAEPRVPDAMQIATVSAEGRPTLRTVLMKAFGPDGFVFYTNFGSRKAVQLDADGQVAALFHWKSLERQVIVEGDAVRTSDATSDAYHATRARGSQLGAWASPQSRPLASRQELEARVAEVEARFAGQEVPRPSFWGGYRIVPHRVEFWQGREDRLHDRIVFTLGQAGWSRSRLAP